MLTLTQGRRKSAQAGTPIPVPFESFKREGINIRRGELSLVAAAPGGGKSAFTQFIVQKGDGEGVTAPAFYFSADSPASTVFQRSAAMATGYEMSEVERLSQQGGMDLLESAVRREAGHIRYCFRSTLTTDAVMEELQSYAMVMGVWPEIIVVDNLLNLDAGFEDEFRNLGEASFFLNDLARDTGAAVITLHHVGGEYEGGGKPVPLSGLRGKVSKLPSLILTLNRAGGLKVSVVKNRSAQADPAGNYGVGLHADLARMTFTD